MFQIYKNVRNLKNKNWKIKKKIDNFGTILAKMSEGKRGGEKKQHFFRKRHFGQFFNFENK